MWKDLGILNLPPPFTTSLHTKQFFVKSTTHVDSLLNHPMTARLPQLSVGTTLPWLMTGGWCKWQRWVQPGQLKHWWIKGGRSQLETMFVYVCVYVCITSRIYRRCMKMPYMFFHCFPNLHGVYMYFPIIFSFWYLYHFSNLPSGNLT